MKKIVFCNNMQSNAAPERAWCVFELINLESTHPNYLAIIDLYGFVEYLVAVGIQADLLGSGF